MKKKFLCSLFIVIINSFLLYSLCFASNTEYISVNVFNNIFYGTLAEVTVDSEKLTTFTTVPTSSSLFTITGKWKDDSFTKDCTITYENGTIQTVTYKNGVINGEVITTYPDGTYQTFKCTNSKPNKKIKTFSKTGKLIGLDWFYSCTPMETWGSVANSVEYSSLFSTPYDYVNLPFKVTGVVDAVYENKNQAVLFIKDDDNNFYYFRYQNLKTDTYGQANIPNLSVGDKIDIIGIFLQIRDFSLEPMTPYHSFLPQQTVFSALETSDSDFVQSFMQFYSIEDKTLDSALPEFNAVSCIKKEDNVDPLSLTYDYEDICTYPFYYIDQSISLTGTVIKEFPDTSNTLVELLVREKTTSNIYAVSFKTKNYDSLLNNIISFEGTLNGNNKIFCYNNKTDSMGYVLYPNITVSEITTLD